MTSSPGNWKSRTDKRRGPDPESRSNDDRMRSRRDPSGIVSKPLRSSPKDKTLTNCSSLGLAFSQSRTRGSAFLAAGSPPPQAAPSLHNASSPSTRGLTQLGALTRDFGTAANGSSRNLFVIG